MIKEEIDKNEESTNKAEDGDETICNFEEGVFVALKCQAKINKKISNAVNKTTDDFLIKHNDFIQKAVEAIMELEDKNKILEKEVDLLKKELDQLKNQGKNNDNIR